MIITAVIFVAPTKMSTRTASLFKINTINIINTNTSKIIIIIIGII